MKYILASIIAIIFLGIPTVASLLGGGGGQTQGDTDGAPAIDTKDIEVGLQAIQNDLPVIQKLSEATGAPCGHGKPGPDDWKPAKEDPSEASKPVVAARDETMHTIHEVGQVVDIMLGKNIEKKKP